MPESFKLQHGLHNDLSQKAISMDQANESFGVPLSSASEVGSPQYSDPSSQFRSLRLLSMSAYGANDPFTVAEKIELLVNIIHPMAQDVPMPLLQCIFVDLQREPLWLDIALPKGRSVRACQNAFEDMRKQYRERAGPLRSYNTTIYPTIAPAPATSLGGSFSHDHNYAQPRSIAPRPLLRSTESPNPPVTNGESPAFYRVAVGEVPTSDPPRKRGRPTKQDVEERERKFAAEGKVYVPKKRPVKRMRTSLAPDSTASKEDERATPLLQTPTTTLLEPVEETSSERRRRRQTCEASPLAAFSPGVEPYQQEVEQEPDSHLAESPSDRLLLSHRDRGSAGSSVSRPTQPGSETLEPGRSEPEFTT